MDLMVTGVIGFSLFITGFAIGKLDSQEKLNNKLDGVLDAVYQLGVKEGESKNE